MAHYDCSCCGAGMGISHDYCENCRAGNCARRYTCGGIVRLRDTWGVVTISGLPPTIDWLEDSGWKLRRWHDRETSHFDHEYAGVPPEVRARATYYILLGGDSIE